MQKTQSQIITWKQNEKLTDTDWNFFKTDLRIMYRLPFLSTIKLFHVGTVGSCWIWRHYANNIQGNVAATSARAVKIDSKKSKHRAVVHTLRLRLFGCTTVMTTLSASSSTIGRPSELMMKICDALWVGQTSLCLRSRSDIHLKLWEIQFKPLGKVSPGAAALWCCPTGMGTGTSKICAASTSLSALRGNSASFCFRMNVRCLQIGQTIVSLMFPLVLTLTRVLTRQSWQKTCPQLSVLSVPDKLS